MSRTIFAFWEPRGSIPPYLRLCMKTWGRLRDRDVVVLDYATLPDYVCDPRLDLAAVKRVPLFVQKDAILAAVLHAHGGVFMDLDTLVVRDIEPLLGTLDGTELVTFHTHLGFAMARAGAKVLDRMLTEIDWRLRSLPTRDPADEIPWNWLGNEPLEATMDEMAAEAGGKPPGAWLVDGAVDRLLAAGARAGANPWLARLARGVRWRRRLLWFRTIHARHYTMLDRERHAFLPERLFFREAGPRLSDDYRRYWFTTEAPLASVWHPGQTVIGLHNSWTPDWYRGLSEAEVLSHDCLLSRTLRQLIETEASPGGPTDRS